MTSGVRRLSSHRVPSSGHEGDGPCMGIRHANLTPPKSARKTGEQGSEADEQAARWGCPRGYPQGPGAGRARWLGDRWVGPGSPGQAPAHVSPRRSEPSPGPGGSLAVRSCTRAFGGRGADQLFTPISLLLGRAQISVAGSYVPGPNTAFPRQLCRWPQPTAPSGRADPRGSCWWW